MCERELETEQNCSILTPTLIAISVSFLFSWATQPLAWGPAYLGAGFLYRILSPTDWISCALSYIIVHAHLLLVGVRNCTYSTHPRSRLHSAIHRADAPVIYIGAFPILTARPGRRSIFNCTIWMYETFGSVNKTIEVSQGRVFWLATINLFITGKQKSLDYVE